MKLLFRKALLLCAAIFMTSSYLSAQNPPEFNNDVMLQGFWWDSYNDPKVGAEGGLYAFLTNRALDFKNAGVDVIWTPPPSKGEGMAYFPTELHNFNNNHGSESQLRAMLAKFKELGMHGMADVVANHRSGTKAYADFTNPVWGCEVIVANDEVAGVAGQVQPCGDQDEGEGFDGSRDMNHKSTVVQQGYKTYLGKLKELGFDSWRWDFTKGFPAKYVGEYNKTSEPYYSVGEYWDGNADNLTAWVNASGNSLSGSTTKSGTFDFDLYYKMARAFNDGSYWELSNPGLKSRFGFAEYAVTFAANHDTHDIEGERAVMQANAYILTHNGIPMVFLKHWLDYTQKMNELIAVRKQNGINAWSSVKVVTTNGMYAAYIDDKVAIKIGGGNWSPEGSGWILNTSGTDYAVWSKIQIQAGAVTEQPDPDMALIGTGISDWATDVPMTKLGNGEYRLDSYDFVGGPVKFRANADWAANWGGTAFPSGTAVAGGEKNLTVPAGTYTVTFNYKTREYTFIEVASCPCEADDQQVCANGVLYANACKAQCAGITDYTVGACETGGNNGGNNGGNTGGTYASIGLIGSAIGGTLWASDVDMSTTDGINYTLNITLIDGEVKFRQDDAWTVNWGSADFPTGTGVADSQSNIPVTAGSYDITFNKDTGAYTFTASSGGNTGGNNGGNNGGNTGGTYSSIGLIGSALEGTLWASDVDMSTTDGINYTLSITLIDGEVKFRQDDAWTVNWGSADFPTGTGVADSQSNIPVTAGSYDITFNKDTGVYTFTASSGGNTGGNNGGNTGGTTYSDIGIIGSATSADTAIQWATDIDLTSTDGVTYTGVVTLLDGEAKFRQDDAWTVNWGSADFPSGTGSQDGKNVVVVAGTYKVTFNKTTGQYSFEVDNGMSLSDFNYNDDTISLIVYPNPTSSIWKITSDKEILSVVVRDISSTIVFESSSDVIDGTQLSSGIYLATVRTANAVKTIRLVKN